MKKKTIKNLSGTALKMLIERHDIKPFNGGYCFSDAMVLEGLEIDKKLRMLQPIYNMYVFEEDGDYYFREMY